MRPYVAFAFIALVATTKVPAQSSIPTPESVIGFPVGADLKLIDYDQSIAYFQKLAASSNRIKLIDVGKTSNGHPWTAAIISSPENLAKLDHYKQIAQQLAHPGALTDAQARALAKEGRAFVDISGGLHASEIAGSQHTVKLAYDLLSQADTSAKIRTILDNDILFLWPSINPDGQNIVVHWYREVVGTPYEVSPLHELYQKYIGHDNNRDAYMLNVPESRVVARTWREWEPQIIYVQHQTAPFPTRIWLPPFAEPIAPRVPALMSREVNTIGMTIAQALETNGMPGATHMGTGFDAWYPGYIDYMPMLQNIASYWTETALYQYATPHFYTINDFPANYRDLRPQSLYPSPWPGGWWRISDAIAYMETGSIATLDYAAKYREELQWNRYQAGRNAINKYRNNPPYAYVIPQSQRDPGAAAEMLRRLAFNGIRVSELTKSASIDGQTYPQGTWVIPMDQEFAELVRQLFEPQKYPDLRDYPDGPPDQPYDASGWTLPYQMGVRTVEVRTPLSADARSALKGVEGKATDPKASNDTPLTTNAEAAGINPPSARITGSGNEFLVDPAQNDAFRAIASAIRDGASVKFDNGKYAISTASKVEEIAQQYGLRGERRAPGGGSAVATRLAVFKPWTASMDEGWLEWLLDQYGFRYTVITNADVQGGDLGARFDVVMMASDGTRTIMDGFAPGTVPARYEGGIGDVGVRNIDAFVRGGGTLVCLNQSADFAIDQLHLPVRNAIRGLASKDYFASGSILEIITDPAQPVMAGMPDRAKVFSDRSPVFTPQPNFDGIVLAKYADAGSPMVSGYLLGEKYIQGQAAAVDVHHDRGHVVLIGFRPQWRGQPFGTFRVVFNSALFAGEVARNAKPTPGFWTPRAAARADSVKKP